MLPSVAFYGKQVVNPAANSIDPAGFFRMKPAYPLRSWLLVSSASEAELDTATESGADALIIDLKADGPERASVRQRVAGFITDRNASAPATFVRIEALGSPVCEEDINALTSARPTGFVLPQAAGGADVTRLAALLAAAEADAGIADGATGIVPLATQTPAALAGLSSYAGASARTAALVWDSQSLQSALGSHACEDENGALTTLYERVRNQCLIAAAAAGIAAIDRPEMGSGPAFVKSCNMAWRDGFSGKLATSPDQVAIINGIFGS